MKKMIIGSMLVVTSFVMNGCGGGSDSSNADSKVTVNLLGSWDYAIFTKNSVCDGLLAQGTQIIESLNGDTSKIGDIIVQGTTFDFDSNQNCYLKSVHRIITYAKGETAKATKEDYIRFNKKLHVGDNTIQSFSVTSFSQLNIVSARKYKNGVESTTQYTR